MTADLVIVGAGGFGREAADVVEAMNAASTSAPYRLLGIVDDAPSTASLRRLEERGLTWLGATDDWISAGNQADYIVGIGSPSSREKVDERLSEAGLHAATLVHPRSGIGSQCTLGAGSVVCAGAQLSTNVALGRHVHVNPNATIGHDARLADYVSINPGAIISGEVAIDERTLVGAGAVILQGLRLGSDATVGAAACVVSDVTENSIVKGVPARP